MLLPTVISVALSRDHLRDVSFDCLQRLEGLDENEWLDVKDVPSNSHEAAWRDVKNGLADDVAAFANRDGGLIVIGASEKLGVVADIHYVPLPQGEVELSIQQLVLARIRPVPAVEILVLRSPDNPTLGVVLVHVGRSVDSPHAVDDRGALRFPRRERRGSRLLSESEVSSQYWQRFTSVTEQRAMMDRCWLRAESEVHGCIPDQTYSGYYAAVRIALVPGSSLGMRPRSPRRTLVDYLVDRATALDGAIGLADAGWTARVSRQGVDGTSTRAAAPRFRRRIQLDGSGAGWACWAWDSDIPAVTVNEIARAAATTAALIIAHASATSPSGVALLRFSMDVPERGALVRLGSPTGPIIRNEADPLELMLDIDLSSRPKHLEQICGELVAAAAAQAQVTELTDEAIAIIQTTISRIGGASLV